MARAPSATVIGIHGAPRSGTSWLGQLFNSSEHVAYRYQPFFSYAFRGRVTVASDAPDIRQVFAEMERSRDPFLLQSGDQKLARRELRFPKDRITHIVYKEVRFHHLVPHLLASLPEFKAIGIVRDPRAVIWSWRNAPREFDPHWSLHEEWRHARLKNAGLVENWYGFERWKELAHLFLELCDSYPDRFRIIRYEDLVTNPAGELEGLFRFCGLPLTNQARAFVSESTSRHEDDPYGVHRQHSAEMDPHWRRMLDDNIAETIRNELCDTRLANFLHGER